MTTWLGEMEAWTKDAQDYVDALDALAAQASTPDTFSPEVVVVVTLAASIASRMDAVRTALGSGDELAAATAAFSSAPAGLPGAQGFTLVEAAALLCAATDRLAGELAADLLVASGVAPRIGPLHDRLDRLESDALAAGVDIAQAAAIRTTLDAAVGLGDPAEIVAGVDQAEAALAHLEATLAGFRAAKRNALDMYDQAARLRRELPRLHEEVSAAADTARAKILNPPKLAVPDPAALGTATPLPSSGDPSAWVAAAATQRDELDLLERCHGALVQARDRFEAPLRDRQELRGLLGAYRDRQVTRSDSIDLDPLYHTAHTLAYAAPCDLAATAAAVMTYVTAVRDRTPGREPAGAVSASLPPASSPPTSSPDPRSAS